MKIPKVSIVLPCYNGADMLDGAVESVINQTFQDWELIIVNDCSTDNTLEIANAFAAKDERIRVFSNEVNSKLPATLNRGFRAARGEYWTWTSDDNLLHPTMFEVMVDYLDKHSHTGMVVANELKIDASGNVIGEIVAPDDIRNMLPLNNFVGAAFMYRKDVAEKVGEYREDLFLVEDYEYWMRIGFVAQIDHINQTLYSYRYHNRSLTATKQKEIAERLVRMRLSHLDELHDVLKEEPRKLSLFYYRIVDNLEGKERCSWFWKFFKELPYSFGVRYLFVHLPRRFF